MIETPQKEKTFFYAEKDKENNRFEG